LASLCDLVPPFQFVFSPDGRVPWWRVTIEPLKIVM